MTQVIRTNRYKLLTDQRSGILCRLNCEHLTLLFHRRTRASYVYNECLAWYRPNVVLTLTYTTRDSCITYN